MALRVLPAFLCTLTIASCVPVLPNYNSASGVAEKATSGNYYNQNFYARDDSRIRHVSTTLLNNAASTNEFATALSQPAPLHHIVEPVIETVFPVVDEFAIVEPIISIEPVLPYYETPIVEPVFPIVEPVFPIVEPIFPIVEQAVPYYDTPFVEPIVEPLISDDTQILEPFVPYSFPKPEHLYRSDIPLIPSYHGTPAIPYYGHIAEPAIPYGVDNKFPYYITPAVEPAVPYYGTSALELAYPYYGYPYGPNCEPFTSYTFPGYYRQGSNFGGLNLPSPYNYK